jgi:hypothetical protein
LSVEFEGARECDPSAVKVISIATTHRENKD